MTNQDMVKKLVEKCGSKYSAAKKVGVSWNTLHWWYTGHYKPTKENEEKLKLLMVGK